MAVDLSKLEREEPKTFFPDMEYSEFLCQHLTGKDKGQLFVKVSASPLVVYGEVNYFNRKRDLAIRKIGRYVR